MPGLPYIAALEIGTSEVRAVVGAQRDDGWISIAGVAVDESAGVVKSQIIDFPKALEVCRSVVARAEADSHVKIPGVYLVIGCPDVRCFPNHGVVHVANDTREVTEDDIEAVEQRARDVNLPPDRLLIHSIRQGFNVDGLDGVQDPKGMEAREVRHTALIIHGASVGIQNLLRAASHVPMDVYDSAFSGLCAGLAVLTPAQKAAGVAVIDLGGGSTSGVAYARQTLAWAGSIGVGGDHVTNDIRRGLLLSFRQAEWLKRAHGSALLKADQRQQFVSVEADGLSPGRTVRLSDLRTIIHVRMDELFRWVRASLDAAGALDQLDAGIVLTGGGALLPGVAQLAQQVFNLPCSIGKLYAVAGTPELKPEPAFAAPVGMLRYAQMKAAAEPRSRRRSGWWESLFGLRETT